MGAVFSEGNMTKKKSTQQQQTSYNNVNTYGYTAPPESADVSAVRNFKFTADPSIGYNFASAKNQVANSFNNPIGGYVTPEIRDRILRSSLSNLAMQESQAKSEANQQLQGAQFGQKAAVASMTAPRLIQTGGYGTGSSSGQAVQGQSGLDTVGQIVGIGATAAA
jgi:hypothetical protein